MAYRSSLLNRLNIVHGGKILAIIIIIILQPCILNAWCWFFRYVRKRSTFKQKNNNNNKFISNNITITTSTTTKTNNYKIIICNENGNVLLHHFRLVIKFCSPRTFFLWEETKLVNSIHSFLFSILNPTGGDSVPCSNLMHSVTETLLKLGTNTDLSKYAYFM